MGSQCLGEIIELIMGAYPRRQIDILGATCISVHSQCRCPDQCCLDAQGLCSGRNLSGNQECPIWIQHAASSCAAAGRDAPIRAPAEYGRSPSPALRGVAAGRSCSGAGSVRAFPWRNREGRRPGRQVAHLKSCGGFRGGGPRASSWFAARGIRPTGAGNRPARQPSSAATPSRGRLRFHGRDRAMRTAVAHGRCDRTPVAKSRPTLPVNMSP